jgi:hypothetical protein
MQKIRNKGLLLVLTGVSLGVLGITGMVFFIIQIKNHHGQSMPGKELLGAFVLSPAFMFSGIIMAINAWQNNCFVTGTASREKVRKRLITVLVILLFVSVALIALIRNTLAVIIASILITAGVCALLLLKNTKAFLIACYLAALTATIIVAALLNALPSAPGGTLLIVNGWYRSYMSNRSGNIIGTILLLAVGPLLLAWPLALLAGGLYSVCTWKLE